MFQGAEPHDADLIYTQFSHFVAIVALPERTTHSPNSFKFSVVSDQDVKTFPHLIAAVSSRPIAKEKRA